MTHHSSTSYSSFFSPSAAQYYNSDLSIWLSVDPMVDKYPNLSPYTYCADNPVRLVDILNDKPSAMLVGASNVSPIEYMAAVAGHEIEHASSLTNIQLHYWGDKSAAEIMPNIIKENILWEYFFPY